MREVVGSVEKMLARAGPVLKRLPAGPCIMIEVGVSSAIMAQHLLQKRRDLIWHGIDPWAGPDEQRAAYIASNDTHARLSKADADRHRSIAKQRLREFNGRAFLHRDWSPEAAEGFASALADLIFLDGDHSREGVEADLEAWWRVVRPGGWLGGHDFDNPDPRFNFGVKYAVEKWIAREGYLLALDEGLTWWAAKP